MKFKFIEQVLKTMNKQIEMDMDIINMYDIKIPNDSIIFEDKELNKLILQSLNGSDHNIAKVLLFSTRDTFGYSKDKKWYEFKNHKWQKSQNLEMFVINNLIKYYQKVNEFINDHLDVSKTDKQYSIKQVNQIIKTLETKKHRSNIMDVAGYLYRDKYPKFGDFDTKSYLIGFDNGVFDMKEMKFRDGRTDDMISMTCGYDFIPEYSQHKNDLMKFLVDILPDENERKYLLTYLSTGLIGLNLHEVLTFLIGQGRNGKDTFMNLIALTMGAYFDAISCKFLTKKNVGLTVNVELLSMRKKRIVIASEYENTLNSEFIKFLIKNDSFSLRRPHSNEMEDFKANFITLIVCNDNPKFDHINDALEKRLRFVTFPTKFVENAKIDDQNEKEIDKTIHLKLTNWKNDFMLILLEHYKIYMNEGLKTPESVME